jgi:hypothetical protein
LPKKQCGYNRNDGYGGSNPRRRQECFVKLVHPLSLVVLRGEISGRTLRLSPRNAKPTFLIFGSSRGDQRKLAESAICVLGNFYATKSLSDHA